MLANRALRLRGLSVAVDGADLYHPGVAPVCLHYNGVCGRCPRLKGRTVRATAPVAALGLGLGERANVVGYVTFENTVIFTTNLHNAVVIKASR